MTDKILQWLFGVISEPVKTLKSIAAARPSGWASLVFLAVTLINALVGSANPQTVESLSELTATTGFSVDVPILIFGALIVAFVFFLISTGIIHFIARLFKGTGSFEGLYSAFAFASFPQIFAAPLSVVAVLTGPLGLIFGGLVSFALSVWVLVLKVIAIRESHALTTGKAVGAFLLQFVVVYAIPILFVVSFVAYAIFGG